MWRREYAIKDPIKTNVGNGIKFFSENIFEQKILVSYVQIIIIIIQRQWYIRELKIAIYTYRKCKSIKKKKERKEYKRMNEQAGEHI